MTSTFHLREIRELLASHKETKGDAAREAIEGRIGVLCERVADEAVTRCVNDLWRREQGAANAMLTSVAMMRNESDAPCLDRLGFAIDTQNTEVVLWAAAIWRRAKHEARQGRDALKFHDFG